MNINDRIEFMREGYESYAGSQEERYSMIQSEHDAYETNAYIDIFVLASDGMYTIDAGVSGPFRPSNNRPFCPTITVVSKLRIRTKSYGGVKN